MNKIPVQFVPPRYPRQTSQSAEVPGGGLDVENEWKRKLINKEYEDIVTKPPGQDQGRQIGIRYYRFLWLENRDPRLQEPCLF